MKAALALLATLTAVSASADQTVIPNYEKARNNVFWDQLYPNGGRTLYCDQEFQGHAPLNIEHVYAATWMAQHLQCGSPTQCRRHPTHKTRFNHMEADLHNLYPAMGGINSARSNHRFGIISGEARSLVACDFEVDTSAKISEPRPGARDEIARAIFYMHKEYGLPVGPAMLADLKQCHQNDPPSTYEVWRNDTIERLQGTRNPFIDDPLLANNL